MNCTKKVCTNSATVCPVVWLWAKGREKTGYPLCSMDLGIALCDICAGEIEVSTLINKDGWFYIDKTFRSLNGAKPDHDTAELRFVPLVKAGGYRH